MGTWALSAASLPDEKHGGPERIEAQPRPDYGRTLQVTPGGCFLLRTKLEDATLGRGNQLEVRAWGTFEVNGRTGWRCGRRTGRRWGRCAASQRVIPLSKGKFQRRPYRYDIEEGDTLTLTVRDATKQTFQFERKPRRSGAEA